MLDLSIIYIQQQEGNGDTTTTNEEDAQINQNQEGNEEDDQQEIDDDEEVEIDLNDDLELNLTEEDMQFLQIAKKNQLKDVKEILDKKGAKMLEGGDSESSIDLCLLQEYLN